MSEPAYFAPNHQSNVKITIRFKNSKVRVYPWEQNMKRDLAYFQQFPEGSFPQRFRVEGDGDRCHLTPSPTVKHGDFEASSASRYATRTERKLMGTARGFETLFRVLCPAQFPQELELRDLLEATKLAVKFKASLCLQEWIMEETDRRRRNSFYTPENSLCIILETAHNLRTSDVFIANVQRVVALTPKLAGAISELPETVQNILRSEWERLSSNLAHEAFKIAGLLFDKTLMEVLTPDRLYIFLREHIWTLAYRGTQQQELLEALGKLGAFIHHGKLLQQVERSRSEPAKAVVKELKKSLDKVLGYEFEAYFGALPWNI